MNGKDYYTVDQRGRVVKNIPTVQGVKVWDYSVSRHDAHIAGRHYDLRLRDPSGAAHSWAVPKGIPSGTGPHLAIQQPTHGPRSLDFSGRIPDGSYGAGLVTPVSRGKAKIFEASNDKIIFRADGLGDEIYILKRIDRKRWIWRKAKTGQK